MDYELESFNYWAKKEIVEIKGNICEIFLLRYRELSHCLQCQNHSSMSSMVGCEGTRNVCFNKTSLVAVTHVLWGTRHQCPQQ